MPEGRIAAAYHRGWNQTDKDRGEFYLTIMNDLAEDIEIKGRLTRENLAEALGWAMREREHLNDHMNEIHGKLLMTATESLASSMERGLFKKVNRARILAVAGLPGSGKSTYLNRLSKDWVVLDNMNTDWDGSIQRIKDAWNAKQRVAVSDIMFTLDDWRRKLFNALHKPIRWVYFENNPEQCRKNCEFRGRKSLARELEMIQWLSPNYDPPIEALPVAVAC